MSDSRSIRLGILGGTFDPVHLGHIGLAHEILNEFQLDRILMVPANVSPHKPGGPVVSAAHRLEMLRLATREDPSLELCELELLRGGVSYTVDTLDSLMSSHPGAEFFLIVGSDMFQEMDTWMHARKLMASCHIVVGIRPGSSLSSYEQLVHNLFDGTSVPYCLVEHKEGKEVFRHGETGRELIFFELTPRDISSSEIRERIRDKSEIKNLLPPEVEQYIMRHQLYRT